MLFPASKINSLNIGELSVLYFGPLHYENCRWCYFASCEIRLFGLLSLGARLDSARSC